MVGSWVWGGVDGWGGKCMSRCGEDGWGGCGYELGMVNKVVWVVRLFWVSTFGTNFPSI